MYKKKSNITYDKLDDQLLDLCTSLANYNDNNTFAIKRTYYENEKDKYSKNNNIAIIMTDIQIQELRLPSYCFLKNNFIYLWCDKDPIAKIECVAFKYYDSNEKIECEEKLCLEIKKPLI